MSAKTVHVPRLLEIRGGVVSYVADVLADARFDLRRTVVGTGGGRTGAIADVVVEQLEDAGVCVVARDAAPTDEGVARLVDAIRENGAGTCLAVGGGRVIDTVKQACAVTGSELVSIPTSLAHDGISSPIAALVGADGRRLSVGAVMPDAVVVDLDVVKRAPGRTSRAGAADLLSNLTALEDWRLAALRGRDAVDGFSALVAEEAARSFLYLASEASPLSLEMLARGLVLSGLAMATAGSSRPCSGAEHLISHSLDHLLGERARLHGEQVSLGLLIAAVAQRSLTPKLLAAYDAWALPRSYVDLGLEREVLVQAVMRARATRPARYTILDEIDLRRSSVEALVDAAIGPDGGGGTGARPGRVSVPPSKRRPAPEAATRRGARRSGR